MPCLHVGFIANFFYDLVLEGPGSPSSESPVFWIVFVKDIVHNFSVVVHYNLINHVYRLVIYVPGHHSVLQELQTVVDMDSFLYVFTFSVSYSCSLGWSWFYVVLGSCIDDWLWFIQFWWTEINNLLEFYNIGEKLSIIKCTFLLPIVFNLRWFRLFLFCISLGRFNGLAVTVGNTLSSLVWWASVSHVIHVAFLP